MITQNHNINGKTLPYDDAYIFKDIDVGDNVWLGSKVTILGGVTIDESAAVYKAASFRYTLVISCRRATNCSVW